MVQPRYFTSPSWFFSYFALFVFSLVLGAPMMNHPLCGRESHSLHTRSCWHNSKPCPVVRQSCASARLRSFQHRHHSHSLPSLSLSQRGAGQAQWFPAGGLSGSPWAPPRGIAFTGSCRLVPCHISPLSRGSLRSAGVLTIAVNPPLSPLLCFSQVGGIARHLRRLLSGAREYPMCAGEWWRWCCR